MNGDTMRVSTAISLAQSHNTIIDRRTDYAVTSLPESELVFIAILDRSTGIKIDEYQFTRQW